MIEVEAEGEKTIDKSAPTAEENMTEWTQVNKGSCSGNNINKMQAEPIKPLNSLHSAVMTSTYTSKDGPWLSRCTSFVISG